MKETISKLKERPKDERTAVAGGVAALIALIIFIGWGFFFFKKITRGENVSTPWGVRQDIVNAPTLKEATAEFEEQFYNATEELRKLRDEAARIDQYQSDVRQVTNLEPLIEEPRERIDEFGF